MKRLLLPRNSTNVLYLPQTLCSGPLKSSSSYLVEQLFEMTVGGCFKPVVGLYVKEVCDLL